MNQNRGAALIVVVFLVGGLIGFAIGRREDRPEAQKRISEPTDRTEVAETSFSAATVLEIVPLADGGAYVTSLGEGTWYLYEGTARRVIEVPATQSSSTTQPVIERTLSGRNLDLWPLLQHARRQAQRAAESDDAWSSDDHASDEW